jgi:hypothetical protein
MIRSVRATRYVTPLREGGSLPAVVEADDDGLYVLKFRGAGQGARALIAELVAGEIGRALELPIPEIVFVHLDPVLGRSEPDSEIRALIKASAGLNVALDFLPGALAFESAEAAKLDPLLASRIVWFDAYVSNVDRTARNTNMLLWHKRLMLIDHGAALYFHHDWRSHAAHTRTSFTQVRDHVLLRAAGALREADAHARERLDEARLRDIVALVPDEWVSPPAEFPDAEAARDAYLHYLVERLGSSEIFLTEALGARARLV